MKTKVVINPSIQKVFVRRYWKNREFRFEDVSGFEEKLNLQMRLLCHVYINVNQDGKKRNYLLGIVLRGGDSNKLIEETKTLTASLN